MNPHFFAAPFYFAFIWFRVQGSGGGFAAFFRRWYSRIAAFPSRGRCPEGADRVTMAERSDDRISIRHFNLPASTSPLM